MAHVYSTYEAKARFGEIIRKVQAGQRVVITYRGRMVAEVRPIEGEAAGLAERLADLEREGCVGAPARPSRRLEPLARRPGGLARFLESRE